MAHLRDLTRTCQAGSCTKPAVVELRDAWNAVMGAYCRQHGEVRLEQQKAAEAREWEKRGVR